ncbi:MAG: acetate uptake transporter [Fusobacteriaceae bacterium]|nr:acetate uptake transporter [Fusobacteriaceae bacterium]
MSEIKALKNTFANPAPLGLLGFAMTTILLNIHNAGFYELNAMIMTMGIFYGGIAQMIAGVLEAKKGNTFGMVAFTSYGAFWLSLVGIWVLPTLGLGAKPDSVAMGYYLLMWGLLTFGLFFGTLKGALIGKLVFGSLTILFLLLATANFTGNHEIHTIAGFEGILCGFFAFYEAIALVLNEKYGKIILPLGK